jgi:hypothetical protein
MCVALGPPLPRAPPFPKGIPKYPKDVENQGDPTRDAANVEIQGPALEGMVFLNKHSEPNAHQQALHEHIAKCGVFVKRIWEELEMWPSDLRGGPEAPSLAQFTDFLQETLKEESWHGIMYPFYLQLLEQINAALVASGQDPHPPGSKPFSVFVFLQYVTLSKGQAVHHDVPDPFSFVGTTQALSVEFMLKHLGVLEDEVHKRAKVIPSPANPSAPNRNQHAANSTLPDKDAEAQLRWSAGLTERSWVC